jgi:Aminotransferase class I and II
MLFSTDLALLVFWLWRARVRPGEVSMGNRKVLMFATGALPKLPARGEHPDRLRRRIQHRRSGGIVRLDKRYGERTYIDEAHCTGALGPTGAGAAEHLGVLDDIDIIIRMFSKSLASVGGFVFSTTAGVGDDRGTRQQGSHADQKAIAPKRSNQRIGRPSRPCVALAEDLERLEVNAIERNAGSHRRACASLVASFAAGVPCMGRRRAPSSGGERFTFTEIQPVREARPRTDDAFTAALVAAFYCLRPRVAARSPMPGASLPATKADACTDERARPWSRRTPRVLRLEPTSVNRP